MEKHEEFISEPIKPLEFDAARMTTGAPGVPRTFVWRGETIEVEAVLRSWRKTGPCTHGSGEQYTRRHYYQLRTVDADVMTVYFERQPARGKPGDPRWWLLSVQRDDER